MEVKIIFLRPPIKSIWDWSVTDINYTITKNRLIEENWLAWGKVKTTKKNKSVYKKAESQGQVLEEIILKKRKCRFGTILDLLQKGLIQVQMKENGFFVQALFFATISDPADCDSQSIRRDRSLRSQMDQLNKVLDSKNFKKNFLLDCLFNISSWFIFLKCQVRIFQNG